MVKLISGLRNSVCVPKLSVIAHNIESQFESQFHLLTKLVQLMNIVCAANNADCAVNKTMTRTDSDIMV